MKISVTEAAAPATEIKKILTEKIIISPGFHIDINIKVYVIIFTMIIDEENLNKIINESSEPIKYGKF